MKKIDVLLINPGNLTPSVHGQMPPLGLSSMGCELEKNGFSVKIIDMEIYPPGFDISKYISESSPKIIGISGTTLTRFKSFELARIAKQISSEIYTVYGGSHASFTAEDTLTHIKDIDCIVHGEGEITLLDIVKWHMEKKGNISDIASISYRQNGRVIRTANRTRVKDLSTLSYSRHLLEMEKYDIRLDHLGFPAVALMTSRGCPFDCNFCSASTMFGRVYTMRSAAHIADEIEYCMEKYNIKGVKIFDSTFTLNKDHALSFTKEIKRRKINLPWECEIRADIKDRSLLEAMKDAGCYYVDMGIESADDEILDVIGKKIRLDNAISVLKWCKELDIMTKVFFTFGHAKETWGSAEKTLTFMEECQKNKYITSFAVAPVIKIYPGTRLWKYAVENNLLPPNFSWSVPFENPDANIVGVKNVPVVLQPSFGIKEIMKVKSRLQMLKIEDTDIKKYFKKYTINNILRKLKEIKSFRHPLYFISLKMRETFKILTKIVFKKIRH